MVVGARMKPRYQAPAINKTARATTEANTFSPTTFLSWMISPLSSNPIEFRLQLDGRLKALRRIRLETSRDDGVDSYWHLAQHRPYGRRRCLHPPLQLGDRAHRMFRAAASDEHVVEDQAERVDVGTLIDGLPSRLLGRHVLDRADDGAHGRASCTAAAAG